MIAQLHPALERERVGLRRPRKNTVIRTDDYEALVLLATDCQIWIQTTAHVLNPSPLQRRGLKLLERFK